jgi:uncharacterized DUF497 family protein
MTAMTREIHGFVWEDVPLKNNLAKHGLDTGSIESMFRTGARWFRDDQRGQAGERCVALGRDGRGRPMIVIFDLLCQGQKTLARPLSARRLKVKEVRRYA